VRYLAANSTGWFWHSLARETGRIGHLYSPGAQRGPWAWLPFAGDVGVYPLWDQKKNVVDMGAYEALIQRWKRFLFWCQAAPIKPMWVIVPDVPGNASATIEKWKQYAPAVTDFPRALAVQDGMVPMDVEALNPRPDVICVGGSDEWKWSTWSTWAANFRRVHVLRCNAPTRLYEMEEAGIESTDGTGMNRGDRKQTEGLERWARSRAAPTTDPLWPHVCRQPRVKEQESLA